MDLSIAFNWALGRFDLSFRWTFLRWSFAGRCFVCGSFGELASLFYDHRFDLPR